MHLSIIDLTAFRWTERFADMGGSVENLVPGNAGFIIHSEDIVVGGFRRHGVRSGKDVAATISGHCFEQFGCRFADLMRCAVGQDSLRVHATHKRKILTELLLQLQRIHAGTVALNRVQHVHADFNQVPDYGSNSTSGVERYVKTVAVSPRTFIAKVTSHL